MASQILLTVKYLLRQLQIQALPLIGVIAQQIHTRHLRMVWRYSVLNHNSGTGSYKVKITSTGEITKLYCCGLNTTSMDLSKCPSLKNIYCSGNLFTSIDLSACPALEEFNCPYSLLTSLDVSKNTSLKSLDCMFSKLTSIDLSKNSNLQYVYFEGNAYTIR